MLTMLLAGLAARRTLAAGALLLLSAVLICPWRALGSTAMEGKDAFTERVHSIRITGVEKRVLALYYPWYGTPEFSGKWLHQDKVDAANKTMADHTHCPVLGAYDSTNPAIIDRHLQQARAAGIDTLVCSWWGREDPTDKAIHALVDRAPAQKMTVCVMWERLSRPHDRLAAVEDLDYLLQAFTQEPGYLKVGGKPVVFLYAETCKELSANEWARVLNDVNARYPHGVLAIGAGDTQADALIWDGLYNLDALPLMPGQNPARCAQIQHETHQPSLALSRSLGRLSVITLSPGCDDRKFVAASGSQGGTLIDRQEGKLYASLWEQAITDGPDWVLVNSFNQWHAATEIEPSVELGDRYLTLTSKYAARFKAEAAVKAGVAAPVRKTSTPLRPRRRGR